MITLYTDGSILKNPGGMGGWACIALLDGKQLRRSGRVQSTTNNRMELVAILEGFRMLRADGHQGRHVKIYTDSRYVITGATHSIFIWITNGWITSGNVPVKNKDLWQHLLSLSRFFRVEYVWVKGHSGDHYNDLVDSMAYGAAADNITYED